MKKQIQILYFKNFVVTGCRNGGRGGGCVCYVKTGLWNCQCKRNVVCSHCIFCRPKNLKNQPVGKDNPKIVTIQQVGLGSYH